MTTLMLMLASDILADAGFHTLEASNGDEAKDVMPSIGLPDGSRARSSDGSDVRRANAALA